MITKKMLHELQLELQKLKQELAKCDLELKNAPEGHIRAVKKKQRVQYYLRSKEMPGDTNGKYIKRDDMDIAKEIVKRDYCKELRKQIESQIASIEQFLLSYSYLDMGDVYEKLHDSRKQLIDPIIITNERYRELWQNQNYERKIVDDEKEYYTEKNERVRSKSEVLIADRLYRNNVAYHYERPLYLEGYGVVYPDFTALHMDERKVIIWEHLGMMDDLEYASNAIAKINTYAKNGFLPGKNLLLTYETSSLPLNVKTVQMIIEEFLL